MRWEWRWRWGVFVWKPFPVMLLWMDFFLAARNNRMLESRIQYNMNQVMIKSSFSFLLLRSKLSKPPSNPNRLHR